MRVRLQRKSCGSEGRFAASVHRDPWGPYRGPPISPWKPRPPPGKPPAPPGASLANVCAMGFDRFQILGFFLYKELARRPHQQHGAGRDSSRVSFSPPWMSATVISV